MEIRCGKYLFSGPGIQLALVVQKGMQQVYILNNRYNTRWRLPLLKTQNSKSHTDLQ